MTGRSPWRLVPLGLCLAVGVGALPAAHAEAPPPGTYVFQPHREGRTDLKPRAGEPQVIIFMNRNGGTYTRSETEDDSRTNTSTVPLLETSVIPPFSLGEPAWQTIMACMRELYGPYHIGITDVDPGDVPHIESVVGGSAHDVGLDDSEAGGVAPFTCGVLDTAIVFTFSELFAGQPRLICEAAAQETAHALGLDHENYCPDPMSYWRNCGEKAFADVWAYMS